MYRMLQLEVLLFSRIPFCCPNSHPRCGMKEPVSAPMLVMVGVETHAFSLIRYQLPDASLNAANPYPAYNVYGLLIV
jgi:hypothetical protein